MLVELALDLRLVHLGVVEHLVEDELLGAGRRDRFHRASRRLVRDRVHDGARGGRRDPHALEVLDGQHALGVDVERREYGIHSLIGEATAERIKQEVGAAYPQKDIREIDVRGRNLAEGIPRSFTLDSNEILEALQEPLSVMLQAVKSALEQCPPELAADIAETGMVLTGGGALLRDLDVLFAEPSFTEVRGQDEPDV